MIRFILTVTLTICYLCSSGQQKNEREKRIKADDMPNLAIDLLKLVPDAKNIRYFRESDGERNSFEAKFKYRGRPYSVEFDPEGTLEDVEITVAFESSLEESLQEKIKALLKETSEEFKIIKCQKQYRHDSGNGAETLENALEVGPHQSIFYELEVYFRNKKTLEAYEILYDREGSFVSKRKIVKRATDNILY